MAGTAILSALDKRDALLIIQQELYVSAVRSVNMRYHDLLKNDFGKTLAINCVTDMADEIVRHYFDTSDFYLQPAQFVRRCITFTYDEDFDPLLDNEGIRKMAYNMSDSPAHSALLRSIAERDKANRVRLFEKEEYVKPNGSVGKRYADQSLMEKGKGNYRETQGDQYDELTGKERGERALEVDHVLAAATASYNQRYIKEPAVIDALKEFYNSDPNFQMLNKSANASKGDVRVFSDGKRTYSETEVVALKKSMTDEARREYQRQGDDQKTALTKARADAEKAISDRFTDVTSTASLRDQVDAVCDRWEATTGKTRENLIEAGILDENGKVVPSVKKKLEDNTRRAMHEESKVYVERVLKDLEYDDIVKDALSDTGKAAVKIAIGQVIYYTLPPLVFETQNIIRMKGMTLKEYFSEIEKAGKRIVRYVYSKIGDMIKGFIGNAAHRFVKSFFDIIISLVRDTAKRLVKTAKALALSLVQCVRIIASKDSSPTQKADAVTKILASSITTVAIEVVMEWMEDELPLPEVMRNLIMEPLQIVVTVIATNLVMLILQEADLFNVRYGFLTANIEAICEDERAKYLDQSNRLLEVACADVLSDIQSIKSEIGDIEQSIRQLNVYESNALYDLERINKLFDIGIDFEAEWAYYCKVNDG